MDLSKIKEIVRRKPLLFLCISLGYLLALALVKWGIHLSWGTLFFVIGGFLGIYLLDIAEVFFNLNPSPFRGVVFIVPFMAVSVFVITSSGSMLASGLVLSLSLTLALWIIGEWNIQGNVSSWFRMVAGPVSIQIQRWAMIGYIVLLLVESFIFLR
jgi:hypothetical protein